MNIKKTKLNRPLLLTPGPTNVSKDIIKTMSQDLIHHRLDEFKILLKEVMQDLKYVFKSKNEPLIFTSSGTGSMEAAIVNFLSYEDKILLINNGYFGEHFKKIIVDFKLNFVELKYHYGNSYDIKAIREVVEKNKDLKAILVTHCDTSTGVINNLEALGQLTKNKDMLLIVDSISGLVNNKLYFDKWNLDVVVSASQKGFLMPPGVSALAYSDKAIQRAKTSSISKSYFNIWKYLNSIKDFDTLPFTPAISHFFGLKISISKMKKISLESLWEEKKKTRDYFLKELKKIGFYLKVKNIEDQSNSLIVVDRKEKFDYNVYLEKLRKCNLYIAPAIGDWANKGIRIGLLGKLNKAIIKKAILIMQENL